MTADLTWLLADPKRCPRCFFHIEAMGHRATIDGRDTGCTPSGPLGLKLAEEARDAGMARTVAAHPDDAARVDAAIRQLVKGGGEWTANELRPLLPTGVHQPVIGARVQAAARRGLIRRVGYRPSDKPNTHGHPVTIWRAAA